MLQILPPPPQFYPPLKAFGCHRILAKPTFLLPFFEIPANACVLLQAMFTFSVHTKHYYESLDILNRLQQMDQLIRLKATGNPVAFAARLGISKSMLYNISMF